MKRAEKMAMYLAEMLGCVVKEALLKGEKETMDNLVSSWRR